MRNPEMREKLIEQKLGDAVRDLDGYALKFVSPGLAGVPDRIVLLPGGRLFFVELKAPGQKPRPVQRHRMETLRSLGFTVEVLDDPAQIPSLLSRAMESPSVGQRIVTLRHPFRIQPAEEVRFGPGSAPDPV